LGCELTLPLRQAGERLEGLAVQVDPELEVFRVSHR
jgi:hypothetical protein